MPAWIFSIALCPVCSSSHSRQSPCWHQCLRNLLWSAHRSHCRALWASIQIPWPSPECSSMFVRVRPPCKQIDVQSRSPNGKLLVVTIVSWRRKGLFAKPTAAITEVTQYSVPRPTSPCLSQGQVRKEKELTSWWFWAVWGSKLVGACWTAAILDWFRFWFWGGAWSSKKRLLLYIFSIPPKNKSKK